MSVFIAFLLGLLVGVAASGVLEEYTPKARAETEKILEETRSLKIANDKKEINLD